VSLTGDWEVVTVFSLFFFSAEICWYARRQTTGRDDEVTTGIYGFTSNLPGLVIEILKICAKQICHSILPMQQFQSSHRPRCSQARTCVQE